MAAPSSVRAARRAGPLPRRCELGSALRARASGRTCLRGARQPIRGRGARSNRWPAAERERRGKAWGLLGGVREVGVAAWGRRVGAGGGGGRPSGSRVRAGRGRGPPGGRGGGSPGGTGAGPGLALRAAAPAGAAFGARRCLGPGVTAENRSRGLGPSSLRSHSDPPPQKKTKAKSHLVPCK